MPDESGKKQRPPPKRRDALKLELPFEDAVRAALESHPPERPKPTKRKKRKRV